MRAVIHRSFGSPEDVLELDDIETPKPGEGEVRVRIVLATIHNHDLLTIRGDYGTLPALPARAGTEAMGVIDALGEGVTGLKEGQRVVASTFGVWAEYVTIPAQRVVPVADSIPDEVAAQMIAMPLSALTLLESLHLSEGDWFVQNAANGAGGRTLAQLSGSRGVNVVGLVRREDAVSQLASLGISRIVATDTDDWRSRVAEVTGGAPLQAGIESIGGTAAGDLLSIVADGGTLIVFGALASMRLDLGVSDILFRGITVKGFWGAKPPVSAERRAELRDELLARVADGTLTLPVESIHDLADVREAARASARAGREGKVLLRA